MDETTSGGPVSAGAEAAAGAPETARYEQDLSRSIGILGNVFITLSGVTPASSVFIIVPVALVAVGSGSFLAFVFAAIVGVFMAFCWAELSAAFPIAAGDYALVWHSFKGRTSWLAGPVSFVTFALYVDFIAFIPAVIALGTGTYLAVIVNVNLKVIGAIVMLVAAGIAILNIRLNAVITGIFLAIELAALAIVTILGITHAKNWSSLFHPVVSTGVVIAILNAVIAIILSYGRIFFSSGRDRAWPGPVNGWMTARSERFRSPWFATAIVGILGAVLCLTVSLDTLVNLTGASLVADYALIAIAALFARP